MEFSGLSKFNDNAGLISGYQRLECGWKYYEVKDDLVPTLIWLKSLFL